MLKKLALAAAVAATSSFATYTYFPVGENHTGQVEAGIMYLAPDDASVMQIVVGGEYVVIPNLAIGLTGVGYQLWAESDDCDDDCPDSDGLKALTLGARYWFLPNVGVALDVSLPLNGEHTLSAPDYDPIGFYGAVQFSQAFMPELILGAEAGSSYKLEDEKTSEGLGLKVQAELDYVISSIGLVPWFGASFDMRISDVEYDGHDGYGSGDNTVLIWVGASYSINQMFAVKGNFLMNFAGDNNSLGSDWIGFNLKGVVKF